MSDGPSAELFPAARRKALTGWGRTSPTFADVVVPMTREQVAAAVQRRTERGVIARGLGRSYGDPAQNGGGLVLDMSGMNRVLDADLETGVVTVEAGVSLDRLIELFVPFGFFVPVTPGTRQVTVGGAIGADVHGKNHHADGSFCDHVLSMDLLLADGTVRTVTPEDDPELFWATAGGMGLTGIVLSAVVRLIPIETSLVSVDTDRTRDLDEIMALMAETDEKYRYTVAWLDCLAKGRNLGRSVLTCGEFARLEDLPAKKRAKPLHFKSGSLVTVPDLVPGRLPNKFTMGLFNELWYRKAPQHKVGQLQGISPFFHPLDAVQEWNRAYGKTGFLQYQFVVPFENEDAMRTIVKTISDAGAPSSLTVLKRFGPGNRGFLSFPKPGWTLTLDFPTNTPGLSALLRRLDEIVLSNDGRFYLAKDSRMDPSDLAAMYPRLEEFRAVRAKVDPDGVFVSDQARRLGLA
ncbi:FAD-binding oxidoreductase [Yinghuangia seranimata]|uniref:FAD-binding oxidoreductase n=1 Tax=Yinghuangia seranimata TaxID=408067 RepID=UPI00248B95FE|nr:FAD-binding oxidoreductase [Yinghuangia seranimata]MDI2126270.1 FAD-binding oxidoreductase [Yinghuangia seranimata]